MKKEKKNFNRRSQTICWVVDLQKNLCTKCQKERKFAPDEKIHIVKIGKSKTDINHCDYQLYLEISGAFDQSKIRAGPGYMGPY